MSADATDSTNDSDQAVDEFWECMDDTEIPLKFPWSKLETLNATYYRLLDALYRVAKAYMESQSHLYEVKDDPYDGLSIYQGALVRLCEYVIASGEIAYDLFLKTPFSTKFLRDWVNTLDTSGAVDDPSHDESKLDAFLTRGPSSGNSSCWQINTDWINQWRNIKPWQQVLHEYVECKIHSTNQLVGEEPDQQGETDACRKGTGTN
jgi:hypothetical protein